MRTIIAGSRGFNNYDDIVTAIEMAGWKPTVVLSGAAKGADRLGEIWAERNGVPVEKFPADWNRWGRQAGYIRNAYMLGHGEALIALWDGESRGTKDVIFKALKAGMPVFVYVKRVS